MSTIYHNINWMSDLISVIFLTTLWRVCSFWRLIQNPVKYSVNEFHKKPKPLSLKPSLWAIIIIIIITIIITIIVDDAIIIVIITTI